VLSPIFDNRELRLNAKYGHIQHGVQISLITVISNALFLHAVLTRFWADQGCGAGAPLQVRLCPHYNPALPVFA